MRSLPVGTWPADVPITVFRYLRCLSRAGVVSVEVELAVFVRVVKDGAAYPHRIAARSRTFGDQLCIVSGKVIDVQFVSLTAAISFLRPEVPESRRIYDLRTVSRKRA